MLANSLELKHTIKLINELTDEILAYASLSLSTYQFGQLDSSFSHMEKKRSRYLIYALFNDTIYICQWNSTFNVYLAKKSAKSKHYYVAISHAVKKLVRLIYHLEKTGQTFFKTS